MPSSETRLLTIRLRISPPRAAGGLVPGLPSIYRPARPSKIVAATATAGPNNDRGLAGQAVPHRGDGVTAAIPTYPDTCAKDEGCIWLNAAASHNPGLVWATKTNAQQIVQATSGPLAYYLDLKLSDPAAAPAFADRYNANAAPTAASLVSWPVCPDVGDALGLFLYAFGIFTVWIFVASF